MAGNLPGAFAAVSRRLANRRDGLMRPDLLERRQPLAVVASGGAACLDCSLEPASVPTGARMALAPAPPADATPTLSRAARAVRQLHTSAGLALRIFDDQAEPSGGGT